MTDHGNAFLFLHELEQAMHYTFQDKQLLVQSLSHASGTPQPHCNNERLEFLGDAILGAVISEFMYHRFPKTEEGELTRRKAMVVSSESLIRSAKLLDLDRFIMVGKGLANEKLPASLSANALEALFGAVYLDSGFEPARALILRVLEQELLAACHAKSGNDYKSNLQQYTQKHLGCVPVYRQIRVKGPPHDRRYEMLTVIQDKEYGRGWGSTKKQAEQEAAQSTLNIIRDPNRRDARE